MHMSEVSVIGWIHTIACVAALVLGAWNIVAVKGTRTHKRCGTGYTVAMVVAMLCAFGVYRFDLPVVHRPGATIGGFGVFHWMSVAALVLTVVGYYAASRQRRSLWAYTHPVAMIVSYYLLLGGLINELFVRVNVLRPFAFVVVNGRMIFGTTLAVEATHHINELGTLCLVILSVVKVRRYRRRSAPAAIRELASTGQASR
jgi:uncharacterized membrane protein